LNPSENLLWTNLEKTAKLLALAVVVRDSPELVRGNFDVTILSGYYRKYLDVVPSQVKYKISKSLFSIFYYYFSTQMSKQRPSGKCIPSASILGKLYLINK
jgi:hypothetical protein